jgi:hypothetical protein
MDAALSNESVSDPTLLSENLTRLQLKIALRLIYEAIDEDEKLFSAEE